MMKVLVVVRCLLASRNFQYGLSIQMRETAGIFLASIVLRDALSSEYIIYLQGVS